MPFQNRISSFLSQRRRNIHSEWQRHTPNAIQEQILRQVSYAPYVPQYTPYTPYRDTASLIPPIYVENTVEIQQASTLFPLNLDLKDYIRGTDQTKRSYDINVTSIEEISPSVLATAWDEDDPFATVKSGSIVEWSPRGNFSSSALYIKYEVSDGLHPATETAEVFGMAYRIEESPEYDTGRQGAIGGVAPPTEGVVGLQIENNIIGDPEAEAQYRQSQMLDPTCALAAVAGALASLGIRDADGNLLDYDTLLNQALTNIRFPEPDGRLIYSAIYDERRIEPSRPTVPDYLIQSGALPDDFYEIVLNGDAMQTQAYLEETIQQAITDPASIPSGLIDYLHELNDYRNSPTYDGFLERRPVEVQNKADDVIDSWQQIQLMFEHNGVETHMGFGSDFSNIVQLLKAGSKIIVGIDANELWFNEDIKTAQGNADRFAALNRPQDLDSRANHAVWITGIDQTTDPPTIFINDSEAQLGGAGIGMPIDQFFAAWEDAEYGYIATGPPIPTNERLDRLETEIKNRVTTAILQEVASQEFFDDDHREFTINEWTERLSQTSIAKIMEPSTVGTAAGTAPYRDIVEEAHPGTTQLYEVLKAEKNKIKREILEESGLDPDEIDELIRTLDIE